MDQQNGDNIMTIIDLHAHFPMHLGLPNIPSDDPVQKAALSGLYDLANEVDNYEAINRPRVTEEHIRAGGITGFGSVLYDPEDEFLLPQEPHPEAILHLRKQYSNVESDAAQAGIIVVKAKQALADCIANDRTFLVHGIEGGHALSGDPANVQLLAQMGVCYFIFTHLRYMGLASCAKGLPCKTNFWNKILDEDEPNYGLSPLGFQVLDAVWDTNMMLDVTHCSDLAHADIQNFYKTHGKNKPVISSHAGVRGVANLQLNLSDDMLKFIGNTGGVVGVILSTYWLGADTTPALGFEQYCKTIDYIRNIAGDDAVAIGTDLDGFIQPIADCTNYSDIQSFAGEVQKQYAAEPVFLEKLLWKNAQRVLVGALT
jgi:microsomal dipeptidase-like Zn-dependent dipeptidase